MVSKIEILITCLSPHSVSASTVRVPVGVEHGGDDEVEVVQPVGSITTGELLNDPGAHGVGDPFPNN